MAKMRRQTKTLGLMFMFLATVTVYLMLQTRSDKVPKHVQDQSGLDINNNGSKTVIMVIDRGEDMWRLREAVGSIHKHNIAVNINIYASLEHIEDFEEISTWQNVTILDLGLQMFNRGGKQFKNINPCFVYNRVKSIDSVFLPLNVTFTSHLDIKTMSSECLTLKGWFSTGATIISKLLEGKEHQRHRNACYIKHKKESIEVPDMIRSQVSQYLTQSQEEKAKSWSGKRVALLVPTFNKHNGTNYLTSIFLPSLEATLNQKELEHFFVTMYIGYDLNDPIMGMNIDDLLPKCHNFAVKMHRLPAIRWATAMWNILYNDAMQDDNDYFLQVGDDVSFNNDGWLTAMTKELDEMNGIGVVGPRDTKWDCKIMTQAMVTRKHHQVFGWLYPPEIKDWYSDNWLQTTYLNVKRSKCLRQHTVTNKSNLKRRYDACDDLATANKALGEYLPKLVDYIRANQ